MTSRVSIHRICFGVR